MCVAGALDSVRNEMHLGLNSSPNTHTEEDNLFSLETKTSCSTDPLISDNIEICVDNPLLPGTKGQMHAIYGVGVESFSTSSPESSPGILSPRVVPAGSETVFSEAETNIHDCNTQLSLCERSEGLNLYDESSHISDTDSGPVWNFGSERSDNDRDSDQEQGSRKALKSKRRSDASTTSHVLSPDDDVSVFDADGATSNNFVFNKFGSEVAFIGGTGGSEAVPGASETVSE